MTEKITKTEFLESRNPADGEVLGRLPLNQVADIRSALHRMRVAQQEWEQLSFNQRGDHIRRMRQYLAREGERLAELISRENGKTRADAYITEVSPAIMACDYQIRHGGRVLKPRRIRGSHIFRLFTRHRLQHVPYGVVGIIAPWNYPLGIPIHEILMALMAGNAVLFKSASETSLVGNALKEIVEAGNLPADLFVHINLPGRIAGEAFLEAGVDKLFFTGSVRVGKLLMAKAAESLTPVSLELGGNDPMIVCRDADIKRAVDGAIWAGFSSSGQSCGGIERIYVHRSVYEVFLDRLGQRMERLKSGDPRDWKHSIGVMTTRRQWETVRSQVEDAVAHGATITFQAAFEPDCDLAYPATVLTGVDHDMTLMRDETFGPVLGIMPFETYEEAIRLANDSNLGLSASVWTSSSHQARELASRLQAGIITINDHLFTHGIPNLPWGGFKQSSIGRTHGELGLLEMTQERVILQNRLPHRLMFWWLPVPRWIYERWVGFMKVVGGDWRDRLKGLVKIFTGF